MAEIICCRECDYSTPFDTGNTSGCWRRAVQHVRRTHPYHEPNGELYLRPATAPTFTGAGATERLREYAENEAWLDDYERGR